MTCPIGGREDGNAVDDDRDTIVDGGVDAEVDVDGVVLVGVREDVVATVK